RHAHHRDLHSFPTRRSSDLFGIAAHGGVEDWARAVLEAGAGLLFLAWAVWFYRHREEQPVSSPLLPPLIAFALVVAGQCERNERSEEHTSELQSRFDLVCRL